MMIQLGLKWSRGRVDCDPSRRRLKMKRDSRVNGASTPSIHPSPPTEIAFFMKSLESEYVRRNKNNFTKQETNSN